MKNWIYVVFEGTDFTGKTKILESFLKKSKEKEFLKNLGFDKIICTDEPTRRGIIGELLKNQLNHESFISNSKGIGEYEVKLRGVGLQKLYAIDRSIHMIGLKKFIKKIEKGNERVLILSSRNFISTVVYTITSKEDFQGFSKQEVGKATYLSESCENLLPDLILFFKTSFETILERKKQALVERNMVEDILENEDSLKKNFEAYEFVKKIILEDNRLCNKIFDVNTNCSINDVENNVVNEIKKRFFY